MKYQKKTNLVYATSEQRNQAHHMRAAGMSYRKIGEALGFCYMTVYFWFHPQHREKQSERRLYSNDAADFRASLTDIAARLAEIPPDHRSLTGIICGDPLPGRSALAMRK